MAKHGKSGRRISRGQHNGGSHQPPAQRHPTRPVMAAQPAATKPATGTPDMSDTLRLFALPPTRTAPAHDPEAPITEIGYVRRLARENVDAEAAPQEAIRNTLPQAVVDGLMKRLDPRSPSPIQIVYALEEVLGCRASAVQKIDGMLAVSRIIGESVAGPFLIDYELAEHLLTRNHANRNLGPAKLQQYVEDFKGDRWMENGTGVTVAEDGFFNDGQHRMHGIARTRVAQRMNITVGVTRESRRTVDIGKTRTTGDQLRQEGMANSNQAAAIARALVAYEYGNKSTMGRPGDISSTAIQEKATNNQAVQDAARWAKENQRHMTGRMTATIAGFVHYLLSRIDPVDALVYLDGVLTGAENGRGLDTTDPRWVVRERLQRETNIGKSHPDRVELLFRGWNAHRGLTKPTSIKVLGNLPDLTMSIKG
jgi:hypothetical protein